MLADNSLLTIIVDSREPWFEYIWEEFVRIMGVKFPWRIVAWEEIGNVSLSNSAVLEYGRSQRMAGTFHVPYQPVFITDDYLWLEDRLPVFRATVVADGRCDLFYNAFVHLSRLEEWQATQAGRRINSYAGRHLRKDSRVWDIPIVNHIFERLAADICGLWPQMSFSTLRKPIFEFSHDVDYLRKTPQLRLKQSVFSVWNGLRLLLQGTLSRPLATFANIAGFAVRPSDYWCFDYWEELEQLFAVRSVFYLYASPLGSPRNWLIDPSYHLADEARLRDKLRCLMDQGFEVGLHGSYRSAVDGECLAREQHHLEQCLGSKVNKVRQHWLRYDEGITPYLHEKLFTLDSTLGWNDRPGFRSGCASRYRPYDHQHQRPFTFLETPMLVMDSQIFDYASGSEASVQHRMLAMIDALAGLGSVHVSVNWHQRTCHADYGWHGAYEEILNHVA